MAAHRPARRRPGRRVRRSLGEAPSSPIRRRGPPASDPVPVGLRWSCAVIYLVGVALVGLGGWGLLRGTARGEVAFELGSSIGVDFGFGTSIVVGALLIVFAALLPWLADGPVRIGPLAVTLRIRSRAPGGRRRQARSSAGVRLPRGRR